MLQKGSNFSVFSDANGDVQFEILLFKAPVSSPENITFTNVTVDSAVLQWSAIPEEDLGGFLLGYIICYAEYNHKGTTTMGRSRTFFFFFFNVLSFYAATGCS